MIGVGSTGVLGAFTYLAPATTILATVGTLIIGKIIYIAHDNIIEPIGEITGTFTKGFIWIKDRMFGIKKPKEPDKGLFGNAKDTLFGDKTKENSMKAYLSLLESWFWGIE